MDVFNYKANSVIAGAFANNVGYKLKEEVVANALMDRQNMLSSLLDSKRDIDGECHYPTTSHLTPEQYKDLYEREAIACRVVQCMPRESWQVQPKVYETEDPDVQTPFEKAWDNLQPSTMMTSWYKEEKASSVWEYLLRADILSGIGQFGLLLLGVDDGKPLHEPIEGSMVVNDCYLTKTEETVLTEYINNSKQKLSEGEQLVINQLARQRAAIIDNLTSVSKDNLLGTDKEYSQGFGMQDGGEYTPGQEGTDQEYFGVQFGPSEQPSDKPSTKELKLIFLRPFDESLVQVVRYEWNINNPRFGMPIMYRITLNDPRATHSGVGLPMATVFVHWSRVIHLADNLESSEIFGTPRMRPVLNHILDLKKIYGASAEGYWQAAFTGISLETHPQLGGDVTIDGDDLRDQVENYVNGLQRYFALMGLSAKTLAPTVSDPTTQIDKHLEAICIQLGIPVRIFKGSERGELASSQDDASWNDRLKARQIGYITPRIIVPFIDRLISIGVLPEPNYVPPEEEDLEDTTEAIAGGEPNESLGFDLDGGADVGEDLEPDKDDLEPLGDDLSDDNPDNDLDDLEGEEGLETPPTDDLEEGKIEEEEEETVTNAFKLFRKVLFNEEGEEVGAELVVETPSGYCVSWPDLDSNTDKDKATIASTKTQAMATYVSGNVEAIMPLLEFYTKILGFDDEEARALVKAAEAQEPDDDMGFGEDMLGEEGNDPNVDNPFEEVTESNPFDEEENIEGFNLEEEEESVPWEDDAFGEDEDEPTLDSEEDNVFE